MAQIAWVKTQSLLARVHSLRLDQYFGVLTAAHVTAAFPRRGSLGLCIFNREGKLQKQEIDIAEIEFALFHVPENGPDGPDIGFLQLQERNVSNLKATHQFLELERLWQSNEADPPFLDWVVGVVGEWTAELDPVRPLGELKSPLRRKQFRALLAVGKAARPRFENGFDLFDMRPNFPAAPSSYGGVSGGGVWRVYIDELGDNDYVVRERRLIGVPFYEHGPRSIYDHLTKTVANKWVSAS